MLGLSSCLRAGAWSPASAAALPAPPGAGGAGLAAAPAARQRLQPVLPCQKSLSSPVRQVPRLCGPSSDSCPFSSSSLSPPSYPEALSACFPQPARPSGQGMSLPPGSTKPPRGAGVQLGWISACASAPRPCRPQLRQRRPRSLSPQQANPARQQGQGDKLF